MRVLAGDLPARERRRNADGPFPTLSVLALVLGILGLSLSVLLLGLYPSIAAVILGHVAFRREPHARVRGVIVLSTAYVALGISLLWGLFVLVSLLMR